MHPWHDCYIDEALIRTGFPAIIEIPKGSTNKYELDKETGLLRLDRVLLQRGLLPGRLRLHPADLLRRRRSARRAGARPGAGLSADHRRGPRHRRDADARREGHRRQDRRGQRPRSGLRGLPDKAQLPGHVLRQVRRFFEDYKVLEHKQVVVEDLLGPDAAVDIIIEALQLYQRLRRGQLVKP